MREKVKGCSKYACDRLGIRILIDRDPLKYKKRMILF